MGERPMPRDTLRRKRALVEDSVQADKGVLSDIVTKVLKTNMFNTSDVKRWQTELSDLAKRHPGLSSLEPYPGNIVGYLSTVVENRPSNLSAVLNLLNVLVSLRVATAINAAITLLDKNWEPSEPQHILPALMLVQRAREHVAAWPSPRCSFLATHRHKTREKELVPPESC